MNFHVLSLVTFCKGTRANL